VINDSELSERLAYYLDQARLGVVYNAKNHRVKRAKFGFVIEDMNKNTADLQQAQTQTISPRMN
jgi:hypothetical protein